MVLHEPIKETYKPKMVFQCAWLLGGKVDISYYNIVDVSSWTNERYACMQ